MKTFYSLVTNGVHTVGCTGGSVYVLDKNSEELAVFKGLNYAYDCAISPKGDVFVVKTSAGFLRVYSLCAPSLIRKLRFSNVAESQDDNFCFSSDGKAFYNIERHADSCKTVLSIYDTKDFSLKKRLFSDAFDKVLTSVEYDLSDDTVYLTGFERKKISSVAHRWFVAKLIGDSLRDIRYMSADEHEFYVSYKKLETSGFAEKAVQWSYFKDKREELLKARREQLSLAELWNKRSE